MTDAQPPLTIDASTQLDRAGIAALIDAVQSDAPVGFAYLDREFRYIRVNEALAAMNQLPAEAHLGRTVEEVAPTAWEVVADVCHRVLRTGEPVVNHEVVGSGALGRRGHWLNSIYPIRMGEEIVGIGALVVDISEKMRADEFRAAVTETMGEGLYAVDARGRLTYMNAAAATMLGWTAEELADLDVHEVLHRGGRGETVIAESPLIRIQADGRPLHAVTDTFTRRDGTQLAVMYSAAPLPDEDESVGAVVVFRDATEERAEQERARRDLETIRWLRLTRDALDEGRLVLHSQPIVPLRGDERSEELLLRMVSRDGETIGPGAFLPAAERYGLIREIDHWVVGEAIGLAATGRRVDVNLSTRSLDAALLARIEHDLAETGADPANVVFELTETALMEDIEAGRRFAMALAELGCGLALDDFGTGYASLTYLRVLPVQHLKIDMEFVRDLPGNEVNQHLVRSIVTLAQGLGQKTVAEGVETPETLALLEELGVDYAQGHLLGRPAPLHERR